VGSSFAGANEEGVSRTGQKTLELTACNYFPKMPFLEPASGT